MTAAAMSMKTKRPFRRFLRHTGGLPSERGGTIRKAAGDIGNQLCFLVGLQDWRPAGVVLDFAHCLGTNPMNNSLIDIENIPHLSIGPGILKLIAKDGEEGGNLRIASGSGIICQAAKNRSCITGRQLFGEAGINEIHGNWRSAWVDLGGHRLVLAGTFNGLSALHPLWGLPGSPDEPEFDRGSLKSEIKVLFLFQSWVNR
jgi:hypothetical protein